MTFSETYQQLWQRGLQFSGRSSRPYYWKPVVINLLISAVLWLLEFGVSRDFVVLADLFYLVLLIPGLALTIRRLHDTNRSGWWWLLAFIPILGTLALIWLLAQPTYPEANRYGPVGG